MTHSDMCHDSYLGHDSFRHVPWLLSGTWLIRTCAIILVYLRHDSIRHVPWLLPVPWLIQTCDITLVFMLLSQTCATFACQRGCVLQLAMTHVCLSESCHGYTRVTAHTEKWLQDWCDVWRDSSCPVWHVWVSHATVSHATCPRVTSHITSVSQPLFRVGRDSCVPVAWLTQTLKPV